MGDEKVIHLTRGPGLIISSSSRSQPSNDRVVCCDIQDFVCDGELYRFEYGVSKIVFLMKRAGTCSLASCNLPVVVLHRASFLLKHGFGDYNLFHKNCEDFAVYCKTGILLVDDSLIGRSGQITSVLAAFVALTIIPSGLLPSSLIGAALVVCGLYCFFRLLLDVGYESECAVVAVEKLKHLSNAHNVGKKRSTTTGWSSLHVSNSLGAVWEISYWCLNPESKILLSFKSLFLCLILSSFLAGHLRLHQFKLGKYSAYTIWVLGCWFSFWGSESRIVLWTRSFFLFSFLSSLIYDHPRSFTVDKYMANTTCVLGLWYWTPGTTILQWIKLALVYIFLFYFVPHHLTNHRLMWICSVFFACFVIQSAALFWGLDYSDYVFRITNVTTVL